MASTTFRSWVVIKMADEDFSVHGTLIQGPRCEDEHLVALADVTGVLRSWREPDGLNEDEASYYSAAADVLEEVFRHPFGPQAPEHLGQPTP